MGLSGTCHLFRLLGLKPLVVVCFVIHDGRFDKVLGQRRRLSLPFKTCGLPGIVAGDSAVFERPGEVENRQQITDAEDCGSGGGEDVEYLKLLRIGCVAPRHAQRAENELREEGEVEADECDHCRELRYLLW